MVKVLLIFSVLSLLISCSDKDSDMPFPLAQPKEESQKKETQSNSDGEESESQESPSEEIPADSDETQSNKALLDPEVAIILQTYKEELSKYPLRQERKIPNLEFANRINRLEFKYNGTKSELKLYTHSQSAFRFKLENSAGNILHFRSLGKNGVPIYKAEVRPIKRNSKKEIILIKIVDVDANAVVQVFYAKKNGRLSRVFDRNIDYTRALKKISLRFIDMMIRNPDVVGEFTEVITEIPNVSNASRFSLTISSNFVLESQPLASYIGADQILAIPLVSRNKSNFRTACGVLCKGGISYISASDFTYHTNTQLAPVELNTLRIDFKLDAHEVVPKQRNTLPYAISIKF